MPTLDYPIHTKTLRNGLRVVVSPDHSVPMVAVNLWYDVGSRDEQPGEHGWAHLFEHLMFSGSAHVSSGEHLNLLQSLGGSVNATTWFDRTNYYQTIPTGALNLALWLEADRLATLPDHLDQRSLDTQRDVVKEEKRQRYDNVPYGDSMPALMELAFGADHPYGHTTIGSMADLDAATTAQAADFFRRHYRPDNAVLTLVGDVSVRAGFRKAERFFSRVPARSGVARKQPPPLAPLTGTPQRTLRGQVPSALGYLAWRLPPRDTPAADACELALAVLGDGLSSRLHQGLVRKSQVLSSVGASALALIGGNSLGLVQLRAHPGSTLDAGQDGARQIIEDLVATGPSETELARVKAQLERIWLSQLARFDFRADLIGAFTTFHNDPHRINQRLGEITSLTRDDVHQALRDHLSPQAWAVLNYLPEEDHGQD